MLKDQRTPVTDATDLLGQGATINTLVDVVGRLPPPACVALYGAWGSGKTNTLHNTMERVEAAQHVAVWFDPWQYDQQPDLLGPLIRALLLRFRSYGRSHPDRMRRWVDAAVGLGRMLTALAIRVTTRVAVNTLLPVPLDATGAREPWLVGDDTARLDLEQWLRGEGEPDDEIEQIKTRFKELIDATLELAREGRAPPDNQRVVFFLDDLDRCLPHRAVELIEKVKLLLCGAADCRAVFVFALDRRVVGEAIRSQYGGASHYTGENYLEKVFDVSLETPPVPFEVSEVERFITACVQPLGDLVRLCAPFGGREVLLEVLSLPPLANPRVIKRTLNRLSLMSADTQRLAPLNGVNGEALKRCLVWLAGAERYRELRHLLRDGDDTGVAAVIDTLQGMRSAALVGEAARLASLPGMLTYLGALGLTGGSANAEVQGFRSGVVPTPGTLRWFDDLMRRVGL